MGDTQVTLFWAPTLGAISYDLEIAPDSTGPWSFLGSASTTRWSDRGVPNAVARFYRVAARTSVGRGPSSTVATATPMADATPLPPAENPTLHQVGLNVWFHQDWDGSAAFVDVFKHSRPWQDAANWHNPVRGKDALGWPTADASTVLFSGTPGEFNGTYRLSFEGQATVSVMWAPGSVTNQAWDSNTNTTTADVTFAMISQGSVGIVFQNTRRTPDSPLDSGFANARLYRPGYPTDGSVVFTTPFLQGLGKAGVVRLMDWALAHSTVVTRWADRATPRHSTQASPIGPDYVAPDGGVYSKRPLGVAIEHQIQLCNTLMIDCWIHVPPVADDEYVANMALAARFGTDGTNPYTSTQATPVFPPLHPSLRLYVEYANENWNTAAGFLSFHLIRAICAHLPAGHPVLTPTPDSIYTAVWRYPAWRTWAISEIFRSVFGDEAMIERVRPVLMTQRGNGQNTLAAALTWMEPFLAGQPIPRAMNQVLYGAGGSGYYGVNNPLSADPDQFFALGNYPDAIAIRDFARDAVWTHNYGLRRVAYEGGPGLDFSANDNRNLNADPRMKDMLLHSHDVWTSLGGDLLVYYVLRGPPEWEFTPDITNTNSPKLQALEELRGRSRVAVTLGHALPGRLIARDATARYAQTSGAYDLTIEGLVCAADHRVGTYTAHAGHAAEAFDATLGMTGHSYSHTRLAVWINGERQGEITLAGSSGNRSLYDSTSIPVRIPAGAVVVRLEVLEGNLTLYAINVDAVAPSP